MQIELFGSPAVLVNQRRFEHPSRKAMALLAYLAMRADEHVTRSHLSNLLWGDSAEEQARANLRQTLSQLRKLFRDAGHDPLLVPFDKVVLCSETINIDAKTVLNAASPAEITQFARRPVFLEGFIVAAPEFENWVTAQRGMIRGRLLTALESEATVATAENRNADAAEHLSLALGIDPLQETLHRQLMVALMAQGRTDEALAQFETCRTLLKTELGIEPEAGTRALVSEIRTRRLNSSRRTEPEPVFNRYPAVGPARLFALHGHRQAREIDRHDNAQNTLRQALEHSREARDHSDVTLAVVSDTGDPRHDRNTADTLLNDTRAGEVAVDAKIYDQFQHWSPFTFEHGTDGSAAARRYRLLSEVGRDRMQIVPTIPNPETRAASEFSLAVLPLRDRSPNAGEYALGDVMAEEISQKLSRFKFLKVAAPSACHSFRAQGYGIDEAQRRLGVNYIVDGGVTRLGDRLRVTLTLTDLRTNSLTFSDHFDGEFARIFDHQNDLVDRITSILYHRIEDSEARRAERLPTEHLGAYDWYLRGLATHRRNAIASHLPRDAFGQFSEAINLDPDFARAIAWRICSVARFAPEYFEEPGLGEIHHALTIDEGDAEVQRIAGCLHFYRGDFDVALHHLERATEISPSDAYLYATSAIFQAFAGFPELGLTYVERALALDPFLPVYCVEDHGAVLYTLERHEEAIESLRRLSFPTCRALAFQAASHMALGEIEPARATVQRLLKIAPDYSVDKLMIRIKYRDPSENHRLEKLLNQAGLN